MFNNFDQYSIKRAIPWSLWLEIMSTHNMGPLTFDDDFRFFVYKSKLLIFSKYQEFLVTVAVFTFFIVGIIYMITRMQEKEAQWSINKALRYPGSNKVWKTNLHDSSENTNQGPNCWSRVSRLGQNRRILRVLDSK